MELNIKEIRYDSEEELVSVLIQSKTKDYSLEPGRIGKTAYGANLFYEDVKDKVDGEYNVLVRDPYKSSEEGTWSYVPIEQKNGKLSPMEIVSKMLHSNGALAMKKIISLQD